MAGALARRRLAPLVTPTMSTEQYEEETNRPGAPVREDWVLPLLLQFNGEPVVTDDGDIVYRFADLMETASDASGASGGALAAGGGLSTASREAELRAALAFRDAPPGWRPAVGNRVVVSRIRESRSRRNDAEARRFEGMEGTVVSDDRDGLPFGVSFGVDADADGRPNGYFALAELVPCGLFAQSSGLVRGGSTPADIALVELEQPFSTAPPSQLAIAGVLGAANLAGVLYIGRLLSSVAGVPASALGTAGPTVTLLRRLFPPLLAYATGFVALPVGRAVRNRRVNRKIAERNALRADWAAAVGDVDVDGARSPSAPGVRSRLRTSLKRKLRAARELAPSLRRFRRSEDNVFSTADGLEQNAAKVARHAGGSTPPGPRCRAALLTCAAPPGGPLAGGGTRDRDGGERL